MSDVPYISDKDAAKFRQAQAEAKGREAVARELASLRLIQDALPYLPRDRRTAIEWTRRRFGVRSVTVLNGWVLGSHDSSSSQDKPHESGPTHVAVNEAGELFGGRLIERAGIGILTVGPWLRKPHTVSDLIAIHETERIVFSALRRYATDVSWFLQTTSAVQEGIQRLTDANRQ